MIPASQSPLRSACSKSAMSGSSAAGSAAAKQSRQTRKVDLHRARTTRALAMLSLQPVHALPLAKVHVRKRQTDGAVRVFDRPTGQELVVYTPRFTSQFRAGHRAGRWYVRPLIYVGVKPQSASFATAKTAIEAVSAGAWSLTSSPASQPPRRPALRVIWPDRSGG
jgi:hypothetical protein